MSQTHLALWTNYNEALQIKCLQGRYNKKKRKVERLMNTFARRRVMSAQITAIHPNPIL